MSFEVDKKRYMDALHEEEYSDNSKKGCVDEAIKPLLAVINKNDKFYTTSSCAGRIALTQLAPSGRKDETEWLFVSHDFIEYDQLQDGIARSQESDSQTFFRQEPAILHVVTEDMESANALLQRARECGFKHSGILSTTKRIIVQLITSEKLDAPVAENKTLLVSEEYMKTLVRIANDRLRTTREKMDRLLKALE